ncbi:MAG: YgfZ/GcvT domain-containing protein [Acidimicrobiia bacterium]
MSELRKITGAHELVVVEGADAKGFLNDLLSQELDRISPTLAIRSFLLSPQGRLRALLWVFGTEDRIGLIADAGVGDRVADDLSHYKIRVKATINRPVPVTTVVGSLPEGAVAAPLGEVERGFVEGEVDSHEMTRREWDALRVEAGEPVMDLDIDEKTIPQETGLVGESVSFEKGCYLGQELVARLDSRGGRVNRHLHRVELQGPVVVPAEVMVGGEAVGTLTTLAFSTTLRTHLGLGLLHRTISAGDLVSVAGVEGVVDPSP